MRRLLATLVIAAALGAACSADGAPAPTSLPPTTATPTPFEPAGAADVVRRWVADLAAGDLEDAGALMTEAARERAGGPAGLEAEREAWARWATAESAVFDALPVADGLAVVVLRAAAGEEDSRMVEAAAVPVRAVGDRWAVDAFGDVGDLAADPPPGSSVETEPVVALVVDGGVDVVAFVDGQPAEDVTRSSTGQGRDRVELRPARPLGAGDHHVTVVLLDGDVVAARVLVYRGPE